MVSERRYSIGMVGGVFVVKKPESELAPKFLAQNPKDGELFLLLGDNGSYSLLKGNVANGLQFCKMFGCDLFSDCFAIFFFEQNEASGILTDPDSLERADPVYDPRGGKPLEILRVVPFRVVE